eukprot:2652310-Rhodomonas_salina.1
MQCVNLTVCGMLTLACAGTAAADKCIHGKCARRLPQEVRSHPAIYAYQATHPLSNVHKRVQREVTACSFNCPGTRSHIEISSQSRIDRVEEGMHAILVPIPVTLRRCYAMSGTGNAGA